MFNVKFWRLVTENIVIFILFYLFLIYFSVRLPCFFVHSLKKKNKINIRFPFNLLSRMPLLSPFFPRLWFLSVDSRLTSHMFCTLQLFAARNHCHHRNVRETRIYLRRKGTSILFVFLLVVKCFVVHADVALRLNCFSLSNYQPSMTL